jgi:hypothetical protein
MKLPPSFFEKLGKETGSKYVSVGSRRGAAAGGVATRTEEDRFRAKFGTSPAICAALWHKLEPETTMLKGARPMHLLWALMLMKIYATEAVLSVIAGGVDESTFRKWSWEFVEAVSYLESSVVSDNLSTGSRFYFAGFAY